MEANITDAFSLIGSLEMGHKGPPAGAMGRPPGPPPPSPPLGYFLPILIDTLFIVIGGVGNIGTITAFYMDYKVRAKMTDRIILALAVADLCVCLIVLPNDIANVVVKPWYGGEIGCRILFILEPAFIGAGINLVVLLSLDRYLMLRTDYSQYMKTQKRVLQLIALCLFYALLPGILENATWNYVVRLLISNGERFHYRMCIPPSSRNINYQLALLILFRLIPIVLVLVFGVLFLIRLRRRLLQWKRIGSSGNTNTLHETIQRKARRKSASVAEITDPYSEHKQSAHVSSGSNWKRSHLADKTPSFVDHSPEKHDNVSSLVLQSIEDTSNTNNGSINGNHITSTKLSCHTLQIHPIDGVDSSIIQNSTSHGSQQSTNANQPILKMADKNTAILRRRYIKPTITYIVLVSALIVCTTPLHIYTLSTLLSGCPKCFNRTLAFWFKKLIYFNSCLNPILYALTNKKIRCFYHRKLKKAWHKIRGK